MNLKAAIIAQADVTEPLVWEGSPQPFKDRYLAIAYSHQQLAYELARLTAIENVARAYRRAETDGTPRLWRGKPLQDLANALDDALEEE